MIQVPKKFSLQTSIQIQIFKLKLEWRANAHQNNEMSSTNSLRTESPINFKFNFMIYLCRENNFYLICRANAHFIGEKISFKKIADFTSKLWFLVSILKLHLPCLPSKYFLKQLYKFRRRNLALLQIQAIKFKIQIQKKFKI